VVNVLIIFLGLGLFVYWLFRTILLLYGSDDKLRTVLSRDLAFIRLFWVTFHLVS